MQSLRISELYELLEASRETDNTDLEAEETAVIAELLGEVVRLNGLVCESASVAGTEGK